MIKAIFASLSLALLVGCSAVPKDLEYVSLAHDYVDTTGQKVYDIGSGIQWNEDYIVTANHVVIDKFAGQTAYVCDNGCDLKFVRRPAEGKIAQWREPVANENLTAVGVTLAPSKANPKHIARVPMMMTGVDANTVVHTVSHGPNDVLLASMDAVPGMSGGPVYGDDHKVVGMVTGGLNFEFKGKVQPMTVYVPYGMIKQQWDRFQAQQAHKATVASNP